jgi:hypothetical protein
MTAQGVHVRQAIIVFHNPLMYVNNVEFIRLGLAVTLVRNSNTLYSLQLASRLSPALSVVPPWKTMVVAVA